MDRLKDFISDSPAVLDRFVAYCTENEPQQKAPEPPKESKDDGTIKVTFVTDDLCTERYLKLHKTLSIAIVKDEARKAFAFDKKHALDSVRLKKWDPKLKVASAVVREDITLEEAAHCSFFVDCKAKDAKWPS